MEDLWKEWTIKQDFVNKTKKDGFFPRILIKKDKWMNKNTSFQTQSSFYKDIQHGIKFRLSNLSCYKCINDKLLDGILGNNREDKSRIMYLKVSFLDLLFLLLFWQMFTLLVSSVYICFK